MANKPKPAAEKIAEDNKPGWTVIKPTGPMRPLGAARSESGEDFIAERLSKVDAATPPTRALRRKFLGEGAPDSADDASSAKPVEANEEIVDMKSGDLERTFGVNVKTQKIDWSQG